MGGLGNENRIFGKFVKKTVTFCSNLLVSSLILQIIFDIRALTGVCARIGIEA